MKASAGIISLMLVGSISLFGALGVNGLQAQPMQEDFATISSPRYPVAELRALLTQLASTSDNAFFRTHCASILNVIDAKGNLTSNDSLLLSNLYTTFADTTTAWNASRLSSYLERKRPFIVSWISPTDGVVSLAWLILPENWDPDATYPLYVRLHGLWSGYQNPIEYMIYYLKPEPVVDTTFEDAYVFLPWGRGNLWYQGLGETDIWEGIEALEAFVHVDPARKYLVGFSMGGFGAWYLGQKSPDTWAALGVFAGALSHGPENMLSPEVAQRLKDVPVYVVCGANDGLLSDNQRAYQLLQDGGNPNLSFSTFDGAHVAPLEQWRGMFEWLKNFSNDSTSSGVGDHHPAPAQIDLINICPNPVQQETLIRYSLSRSGEVELVVYNAIGQRVHTLTSFHEQPGQNEVRWDGRDDNGQPAPNGVYFCQVKTQESRSSRKLLVMKR